MDFSKFNKKKDLNEVCEVFVVDFVNKIVVLNKKINNLIPDQKVEAEILKAQEVVKEIRLNYIKEQELIEKGLEKSA